jgi:hypothetical protein
MNMPGMSQRWINVDFLTTEYRIVGRVLVGNSGLHGLLSDQTKSYIDLRQAQIAYLRQPTHVVQRYECAYVIKERIYVASMERKDYAGPTAIAHRAYTEYQRYPLHIAFGAFEMDCSIEWTGRFEMASLLADKSGKFLLVYDAMLSSSIVSGLLMNTPASFINMNRVDLIALAPQDQPPAA